MSGTPTSTRVTEPGFLFSSPVKKRLEHRTTNVARLLDRVRTGGLRIPDFQRPFRWRARHVLDLLDSVYRGYPIGEILFVKKEAPNDRLVFGPLSLDAPAVPDAWYVVDGQQRLTALAGALLHPRAMPRRDICAVWFDLTNERFVRLERGQPPAEWIPLRAVGDLVRLSEWIDDWPLRKERPDLVQRARELQQALLDFEVTIYVVEESAIDVLREIFRRVNTSGVSMNETEVFDALSATGERQPAARSCLRLHQETGFGTLPEALFVRCLKAVQGLDAGAKFDDKENLARILAPDAIGRTESALRRAVEFLQEDADFPHGALVPYLTTPTIVLARFFEHFPVPSARTRLSLRWWVWRGALSGEHASSSQGLIKRLSRLIDGKDEDTAALNLLRDAPGGVFAFPSSSLTWNPRNAGVRACMAALLSRAPADHTDEIPGLAEDEPSEPDTPERPSSRPPVFAKLGGGTPDVVAEAFATPEIALADLLRAAPEDRAAHFVSDAALAAAQAGDAKEFVRLRAADMDRFLTKYFRERCGAGEIERPSIPAISKKVEDIFRAPSP